MILRTSLLVSLALVVGMGCKKPKPPSAVDATPSASPLNTALNFEPEEKAPGTVDQAPEPPKPDRKKLVAQVNDAVALLTLGSDEASKRALTILKNVVNVDDSIAYAHFNVGVAHQQLNQLGAARMAYERALDADQELAKAWLAVGLLQDIAGNPSRAIAKYRQGLEYASDDIDLHVALIGSLRRQNRLGEAIQAARDALKINSNSLAIYNELGLVYLTKKDLGMARFVYLKAFGQVDGAKNNAAIRCHLGRVLYLQDEKAQAERELMEAYALDQKYFSTLIYLAEIHLDNRAYEKAVPLLEEVHRQQPDHHGVAMNLGLAYRGVGKYPDSKRLYEQAISIDSNNADPYLNLGILYGDYTKEYDQAIESFNAYISKGGARKAEAEGYVVKVEKERKRADKKRAQDAERKKREAERAERERLLKEAEEKAKKEEAQKAPANDPWGGAGGDSSGQPESPEAPKEEDTNSPWESP